MQQNKMMKKLNGPLATISPFEGSATGQPNEGVHLTAPSELKSPSNGKHTASSSSGQAKVNDLSMYYESVGEGEPVVFIAGIASDHLEWLPAHVPAFIAAGYRCVVFDNRDVGQTGESGIASYNIRQLAEDTAGLLEQLGLQKAHVVGESMGGMIAQELAINFPERVRSLTLVCTSPRAEPFLEAVSASWINARRKFTLEEFFQTMGLWLFTPRFYDNPEAEQLFLAEVRANPYPQPVSAFERQRGAMLSHDTLDRLERITAPTHIIGGELDILFPQRHSRMMAEKIPGAKLTVIPDGAHVLAFENSAAFNTVALEFLKKL